MNLFSTHLLKDNFTTQEINEDDKRIKIEEQSIFVKNSLLKFSFMKFFGNFEFAILEYGERRKCWESR